MVKLAHIEDMEKGCFEFFTFFTFLYFFSLARVRPQFFSRVRVTSLQCSYVSIANFDKLFWRKKFFKDFRLAIKRMYGERNF